jgi:predicted adenine nucleotide alpha hydrolase (AANH) superfamily ATPase
MNHRCFQAPPRTFAWPAGGNPAHKAAAATAKIAQTINKPGGAAREAFDAFSSSLLYSRRQAHEIIAEEGERAASISGTAFLYRDFRPAWQEGIRLSKE